MKTATHITLSGAPEGFDAKLLLAEAEKSSAPLIHVARDDKRMAAMQEALRFFAPDMPVIVFPGWDCLPYDRVSPNADISAQRMATLAGLVHGMPSRFILLTTLGAATQRVPARDILRDAAWSASVGGRVDEKGLRAFLVRMGFVQSPTVMEPGDYAVRGGIIDIFPPGDLGPVRLDLFGDVLDGARRFDPATQRTTEKLDLVELAPVSEVILDEAAITRFRQNYRIEFGAAGSDDPLYEAISAGRKHQGAEHWLSLYYDKLETLFDYLPEATVTLDDQLTPMRLARWDSVADQYETRKIAMANRSKMDSVYKPAPAEGLYLDDAAWEAAIADRRVLQLASLPQPTGPNALDADGRIGRNFSPERQQESISLFGALASHIKAKLELGPVLIASYSEGARERLTGLIEEEGLAEAIPIPNATRIGRRGLHLAVWALEHGFEAPLGKAGDAERLTVISEQDVLGDRLIRRPKRKKRAENFLSEVQSLTPNDLVVHVDHGIGRYLGMEVVTAVGAAHECLVLEYAEASKLYLPVENIELLSKYGHEEGLLDKLGGGAWQSKKAKLKERIREMADKLIRIAAERALRRAPVLEPPEGMWDAFSARFPYQETDDQLSAIGDVIDDLTSGNPMDRLVVGDVGFGKTEVAMRAAFVAAMSGVQVAVIAPTTLLARQHYKSFAERFRGFPIEVRQLSRFVTAKEAASTRDGIAKGTVDIVIGTHALLAKTIKFKDLGLLVIDEEQHFGVGHKERLKSMRTDVHVLTLTATPIPRTLQLSLTGVRDLSIIGTPPVDRLSIRTYVSEFDAVTLREALLREHYRGGQSFYVVPRISDLPEIEAFLKEQLPELTYVVAHGQMAAGELDERMNAFYDGSFDVLLATTIVESGLDIPTANTMIVHRADMFGLAQLYQIRGRVGRSKTRAYAYLTTKPREKLTATAEKRLRVIGSLDTLGAGFTLASQDMDIRGAGNLLGEEQSGQMRDVGFELYQSMLEEAISKIRSGELEGVVDSDGQWAPQINLGVPVLIPDDYVPDLDVRLGLYRRLSELTKKVELEGFAAELIDRFGKLPREVNTLMLVVRIKAMCKRAGISKLDGGPKGATIQFHNDKFASPEGLVQFIQDQRGLAKVKDNKIVVRRDWKSDTDKIKGAFSIARDLAEHVVAKEKAAKKKAKTP
ncbi:transcription-repair coupling factor [Sulfitobacter donghicola]|uniref:Transcription-repair-coupling factor n=1 Tax=Sulfitobacter donghicola DSW-25 = KCTC 12864 = JCM 14565 TaxID=1300350 RepID=A0A073ISQ1_9RHOB|nr:transcription-repair coupling factor [Sulfitobacter donghicola]KEJ88427.1 transcription-repair coupling factor [Sulfitobacter donghicola DSW-25 = KCTC 12864 = JCM 14565]KIN69706.1 Transcription-repair coupling factor [Sulfitobacter donghicola DSW-25 = KCTC 12864 = JCM 14565]